MKSIERMQGDGLSASRLAHYLDEVPSRAEVTDKRLLSENASVARFNEQFNLSVFPDDIAYRLASEAHQGGMSVARILGHLRSWQYGILSEI